MFLVSADLQNKKITWKKNVKKMFHFEFRVFAVFCLNATVTCPPKPRSGNKQLLLKARACCESELCFHWSTHLYVLSQAFEWVNIKTFFAGLQTGDNLLGFNAARSDCQPWKAAVEILGVPWGLYFTTWSKKKKKRADTGLGGWPRREGAQWSGSNTVN